MKVRIDFVSNSSSCSFVIEEPKKFIDFVVHELNGNAFFYDIECLKAFIAVDEQDREVLENVVGKPYVSAYDGKCIAKVSNLADIISNIPSKIPLEKLKSIELECDDFDIRSLMLLSVLKLALENYGVKVNSYGSEHPLLFEDGSGEEAFEKILSLAFKKSLSNEG